MTTTRFGLLLLVPLLLSPVLARAQTTPVCGYTVVNTYPHDPQAFTEGLLIHDGELFESTGKYGFSSLRRVDLLTGEVLQQHDLGLTMFGEGIAVRGDEIIQLTWRNGIGYLYDRATFTELGTFSYASEGWGLTHDGEHLVRSDGSAVLSLWNPDTLAEVGQLAVFDHSGPVPDLNELEYVQGEIFANVWLTTRIARINPVTGRVNAYIDLAGILSATTAQQTGHSRRYPAELNGIAYDPATGRLLVTGKYWPTLYEIELPDCPLGWVFQDGFDSGDLTGWTVSTPSG